MESAPSAKGALLADYLNGYKPIGIMKYKFRMKKEVFYRICKTNSYRKPARQFISIHSNAIFSNIPYEEE